MTVDLSAIVSAISVGVAYFFGTRTAGRNKKLDIQAETSAMVTIATELKSINNAIIEMKVVQNETSTKVEANRERLIVVEESTKQAHKRMDRIDTMPRRTCVEKEDKS